MAERLTKFLSEESFNNMQNTYSSKNNKQALNKLGQLEDVMENNGFIDLQDLQDCIDNMYDESKNAKENKTLKSRWEKLKEFIKKEIAFDKDEVKDFPLAPNRHYITAESMILDKMEELEKESKDEV